MKNKTNLIDKLFLIILSVQTGAMGIAFLTQILRIYFSKDKRPFSREIVGAHLMEILPVIIIWLVMIVASFIYFFINERKEKNKVKITNEAKLKALSQNLKEFDNEALRNEYSLLKKENKNRLIAKLINLGILVICSIMGILYLANPAHFEFQGSETPTTKVISMSYYLLPWVIIALGSMIATIFYNELSCRKSIEICKAIMKNGGRGKRAYVPNKRMEIIKNVATYSLLLVAVVLIIVGVFDGTCRNVLLKACAICTECIGLG